MPPVAAIALVVKVEVMVPLAPPLSQHGRESGKDGAKGSRLPLSASLLNLSVSVIEVGKIFSTGESHSVRNTEVTSAEGQSRSYFCLGISSKFDLNIPCYIHAHCEVSSITFFSYMVNYNMKEGRR